MCKTIIKLIFSPLLITLLLIVATPVLSAQSGGCAIPPPDEFVASTNGNTLQLNWTPVSSGIGYYIEVMDLTTNTPFFNTTLGTGVTSFVVSGINPTHQYLITLRVICPGGCISTIPIMASGGIITVEDVVLLQGLPPCGLECTNPVNSLALLDTLLHWPASGLTDTRMTCAINLKRGNLGSARFRVARNNNNQNLILYQDCNNANNNCNCFVQNDTVYCTSQNTTVMRAVFRQPNQIIIHLFDNWTARYKLDSCSTSVLNAPFPEERSSSILSFKSELSDLSLAPNPAADMVRIRFVLADEAPVSILLTDIYGREMRRWEEQLNLPAGDYESGYSVAGVPPGTYFISVHSDNTVLSGQIAIDR